MPIKVCIDKNGEVVWGIPEACHAEKNSGGAVSTPVRTVYMGKLSVDTSGARDHGLAPASFCRAKPTSDTLQHMLMNPYLLPKSVECDVTKMLVPWGLKGFEVFNIMVSLCIAPIQHKDLSLEQRCENAVSGFCLIDMFKILAERRAEEHGLPSGSCFMAEPTAFNLQGVALSTLVVCATKPHT
jgi:hypothetical protein